MNLMSTIRTLLRSNKDLRSSDKALMWEYWKLQGLVTSGYITQSAFMEAELPENIRRCRQKIQETSPELRPDDNIYQGRKFKAEEMARIAKTVVYDDINNIVKFV